MKEILAHKLPTGNFKELQNFYSEVLKIGNQEVYVVRIESSKLSFDDEFMTHEPKNEREEELKKLFVDVIRKVIPDFYRPVMDPSFGKPRKCEDWRYSWMEQETLSYIKGGCPAIKSNAYPHIGECQSYSSWKEIAQNFYYLRRSRLGTKDEYIAFLGVLIKKMIKAGWTVAKAWDAVCNDSKKIGHYCDSEDSKGELECTGSREICGFYDLANTYKILAENPEIGEDGTSFWIAGGCYAEHGDKHPIASLYHFTNPLNQFQFLNNCVGWVVFKA